MGEVAVLKRKPRVWPLPNGMSASTNYVPDVGSPNAEILLIGEAPGKNENYNQNRFGELEPKPFVGWSGQQLDRWWSEEDLYRRQFYITNVFPWWPPFKDKQINQVVSKEELAQYAELLHRKITRLPNLRIIVPTGNTALFALTGKRNISNWRGSILSYETRDGRKIKVIPTMHPAATARDFSLTRRCKLDWKRISFDFDFPELRLPKRNHIIPVGFKTIVDFRAEAEKWKAKALKRKYLVHDVETAGGRVTCIGFATSKHESITIPYDDDSFWKRFKPEHKAWAFKFVKDILESPLEKIGQNEGYDCWWYPEYGIKIKNRMWCTMLMHHALDSSDTHSLEYMASIETREPFWKKEGKEPGLFKDFSKLRDRDGYYRYNGKDCCVEFEIFELLLARMKSRHLEDPYTAEVLKAHGYKTLIEFYIQHYRLLNEPLMEMMRHGVLTDEPLRKERYAFHVKRMEDIKADLEERAGYALHGKKVLSVKKVADYLFNKLKLPVQQLTAKDEPSTGAVVLRSLYLKYLGKIDKANRLLSDPGKRMRVKTRQRHVQDISAWQFATQVLDLMMQFRKSYQTSTFYQATRVDKDGRMRCTFKAATVFGRLSSSKSPRGTGANLQNQQHQGENVRDIFVPDKGCFFIEPDLSQVEWRDVCMYSRDKELIRLARTKPWEFDIHTHNATIVFGCTKEEVDREKRDVGKRAVHGCVDDITEVLTPDGWIPFPKLKKGVQVAQWVTQRAAQFVMPSAIHEYDSSGKLDLWESDRISQALTANHRMPYIGEMIKEGQVGIATSEAMRSMPRSMIQLIAATNIPVSLPKHQSIDYTGKVYCVTVPSGFFMVRRNGKVSVTGNSNYGMTGYMLSEILLKAYGIIRTPDECQAMIDTYLERTPGMQAYHQDTRYEIRRFQRLTNNWGRIYHFENYRPDEARDRDGFSSRPQGDAADLMNQWGIIPANKKIIQLGRPFALHQQVHDSMLMSAPLNQPKNAYDLMVFVKDSLERPRDYFGEALSVPATFKIGMTGAFDKGKKKDGLEFKQFPSYEQFRESLAEMLWNNSQQAEAA